MEESILETVLGAGMALLLLAAGIDLTVKLRFVQLRRFFSSLFCLGERNKGEDVNAFSAACTNLGATVGMGNVLGVASAVSVGGAGSLLWMMIAAFFGMAIRFAENALGARLRRNDSIGVIGGPFCYMERFVPYAGRTMGRIYAMICLFGSVFGMGVLLQTRCIRTVWSHQTGDSQTSLCLLAAAMVLLLSPILLGGANRIAKASGRIVPIMTLGYIACCLWILLRYHSELPTAVRRMLREGLSFQAAAGTSVGIFLRRTVLTGIRRGLFSNEAGLGLGAITAAAAEKSSPTSAGDAGILVTFLDTFVICLLTGLCLLVTQSSEPYLAWRRGLPWAGEAAPLLLSVFLTVFALTSVLGCGFYGESCLKYLFGRERFATVYRILSLLFVGIGVFLPQQMLWRSADACNAALAVLNLPALILAFRRNQKSFAFPSSLF